MQPPLRFHVEFTSPNARIPGERCSKLLKPGTPLFDWIFAARVKLAQAGYRFDARPPHIEVVNSSDKSSANNEDVVRARCGELEMRLIDLRLDRIAGRALIIPTGPVSGYGETHSTIAYFRQGLPDPVFETITKLLS